MSTVQPPPLPEGGALPQVQPVVPVASTQVPVANALAHSQQPAPSDAKPPAPQGGEIPDVIKASKGQVIFCLVKILGLVALSPVLLPFACCVLLGETIGAMGNKTFAGFSADVARSASKIFKPLTRELWGVAGGIIGVTGDGAKIIWEHRNDPQPEQQPPVSGLGQAEEDRVMAAGGQPQSQQPPVVGLQPPPPLQADQEAERKRQHEEEAERMRREEAERSSEGLRPPPNYPPPPLPQPPGGK